MRRNRLSHSLAGDLNRIVEGVNSMLPPGFTARLEEEMVNLYMPPTFGLGLMSPLVWNISENRRNGWTEREALSRCIANLLSIIEDEVSIALTHPWPRVPGMSLRQFPEAKACVVGDRLTMGFYCDGVTGLPSAAIDLTPDHNG